MRYGYLNLAKITAGVEWTTQPIQLQIKWNELLLKTEHPPKKNKQ